MKIKYKNKEVEQICTDIKKAKKLFDDQITPKKLMAKINYIQSANSFNDIRQYSPFNCHNLSKDRKYYWALDINGRKSSYRLIVAPLDENDNIITTSSTFLSDCKNIKIILIEEVSNHYE